MLHNLSNIVETVLLSSTIPASGTSTDRYTDCVDTRGYQGVRFVCVTDTTHATAGFSGYAQLSATSSGTGTFYDVYGSTVTHTTGFITASAVEVVDIYRPLWRWARMYFDRATTAESIVCVIAELYRSQIEDGGFSTSYGVSDVNIVIGASSS
ncbi:MAG: hypothetical protein WC651_03195 [Candidatus Gracilibacteria bacterium]|jgi:hypothetical protein